MMSADGSFMIFAIETSCDETAVAIMSPQTGEVHASRVSTQIATHAPWGGVVPNLAARDHFRKLPLLAEDAMREAEIGYDQLSCIAWTRGPGLIGALAVGASFGGGLASSLNVPKLELHHLEAHMAIALREAGESDDQQVLALLVSGGHTMIIHARAFGDYQIVGETRDDAVGECFDKVGRILGLPFPGGPEVERLAATNAGGKGLEKALPRPMLRSNSCDMSFSGLKTAVLYRHKDLDASEYAALAEDFQEAIAEVLCTKLLHAIEETGVRKVVVAGGVAANKVIRSRLEDMVQRAKAKLWFPPMNLCVDNAVMVAELARRRLSEAHTAPSLEPLARWSIETLQPPRG